MSIQRRFSNGISGIVRQIRLVNLEILLLAMASFAGSRAEAKDLRPSGGQGITVLGAGTPEVEEAVLFAFDNISIPFLNNLRLQMDSPRKHPQNPVVKMGEPGSPDEWSVQFYGSIIHHEGKFKMWYVAADEEASECFRKRRGFHGWRPAYAESRDGINWVKPNLGLVTYRGNHNNNLLLIDPPEAMGLILMVLHEPDDPDPSRRFKMMLEVRCHVDGRRANTSLPLFSEDGLRWQMPVKVEFVNYRVFPEDFVLPAQNFEQSGLYRWGGVYHLLGQQLHPWAWLPDGEPCGRVLTIFRSRDLIHWSETRTLAFVRDGYRHHPAWDKVGHAEESHQAGIWPRGNVLLATYGIWHGAPTWKGRTIDLGLLISNDGLHFREPIPNFVFIPRGQDGAWDQGGLLQSQGFENVGEESYIYYGHWDPRVGSNYTPRGGVGLVTLPRDRFGSLALKNPSRPASCVTCALRMEGGGKLRMNVDGLSSEAWLRVELLDEWDRPLPGYSGNQAAHIRQSGLAVPVSWKGGDKIEHGSTPFRVNVRFEGAQSQSIKLYALYLTAR